MEWFDPSPYIQKSEKITDIFGYWPSFHDAEVKELRLSTADGEPWEAGSTAPVLEMQIHVFEMTKEVTEAGYFVLKNHTLVRLRFRNVEGLQLSNFSYQNCIFGMDFGIEPMSYPLGGGPAEGPAPNLLTINIDSSFGLSGEFKCQAAEVISAIPCDPRGMAHS